MPALTLTVTERERDTILAALRMWQAHPAGVTDLDEIATNGGKYEALTSDEIESLCEELNFAAIHHDD